MSPNTQFPSLAEWKQAHLENLLCTAMDDHLAQLGAFLGIDPEPIRILHAGLLEGVTEYCRLHYSPAGVGELMLAYDREQRRAAGAYEDAKRAQTRKLKARARIFRRHRRIPGHLPGHARG